MKKTYIIAEIGINHNGLLDNCFKLIDVAYQAGCDAAKFQTFSAEYLYPRSAGKLDWKNSNEQYSYDIYKAVKSFELPYEWIGQLIEYCNEKGIDFISSVYDPMGLESLLHNGMTIIKLSSYTITHIPLVETCAETGFPIIMSTGGATLGETETAVEAVKKYHNNLQLLHCSIKYPTKLDKCNLGVIKTLQFAFPDIGIGYSDHTLEVSDAPVQAVYLDATVIEKHITLGKDMEGPDHFFALEPSELKKMVTDIRKAEKEIENTGLKIDPVIYGNSAKICYDHEKYLRDFAYMTLFAKRRIKTGEIIMPEDIAILRPGKKKRGLDPEFLTLFESQRVKAKKDLAREELISWNAIL